MVEDAFLLTSSHVVGSLPPGNHVTGFQLFHCSSKCLCCVIFVTADMSLMQL